MILARSFAAVGILLVIVHHPLGAQSDHGSTPYRLDFARWAWASPQAERQDRAGVDALLARIHSSARMPLQSAVTLRRLLLLADSAAMLVGWHATYWHVRSSLDTRDREGVSQENSLYQALGSALDAASSQIAKIDAARVRGFLSDPTVAHYRSFIEDARRPKSAIPPQAGPLVNVATSWQFDLYERLLDATDFGTVPGPSGRLDVRRDWYGIQADGDSATRREAFDKLYAGYGRIRDLLSFALVETVKAQNETAHLDGFADRPSQAYHGRGVSTAEVRALISAVRSHSDIMRRFEVADAQARNAPFVGPRPLLSLHDATEAMTATFASLGPDLRREADALFDPASGRLEIGGGEHARSGGFSFVLRDDVSGVYLDHFGGSPPEVSRLMHESGHALHRRLFAEEARTHLQGPQLSEVVALFGEILLADRLAADTAQQAVAIQWRRQFLNKLLEVFYGAKDAELEQTIYDSVAGGSVATADDFDRLTRRVDSAYSADRRPAAGGRWMQAQLLFEDPLYLSNYLYSGLIGAELYTRYRSDPTTFASHYLKFLHDVGGGSPQDFMARDFGLRLDDPSTLERTFTMLDTLVNDFAATVARVAGHS